MKTGDAKKILYLHIGFHKTGTTSIQSFLNENREWLAERGMYWPGELHRVVSPNIRNEEELVAALQKCLRDDLIQSLVSSHSSCIMSSEYFPFYIDDETLQWIRDNFTTTVIAVVRNPVATRESGYQQTVKDFATGNLWGYGVPQEYIGYRASRHVGRFASIFGAKAITALPYDFLSENDGLLPAFMSATGLADLGGSSLPERLNERLGYDHLLFLRQALFLPLPMDIRGKLCQTLIELSVKNGDTQSFLTIPRENHQNRLRSDEQKIRDLGKTFLHVPDWFEHCQSYLKKQKDADYTELPTGKQRAIFDQLPSAVQEALDKAMPASLKPKLLPPLPADPAAYALLTKWVKNSVVQAENHG